MTTVDATSVFPISDDASISDDLLSPEDLTADELLRDAPRLKHLHREMPSLDGIPLYRKLGEGGMGAVYYGVQLRLHREVAVKILTLRKNSFDALARFEREARICAKLSSPHLVKIHDIKQEQGLHFMVMEFVRGGSASELLNDAQNAGENIHEAAALDLCIAIAEGLKAAHEQGVIHRDIKPGNILVPKPNLGGWNYAAAKLADLGLARSETGGDALTRDGHAVGTPGFMSPEQLRDPKGTRKPADIFSIGATLYALLTGKAPFTGKCPTDIVHKTIQDPHTPILELRKDISPVTCALIDQCLAKDPALRFPDAFSLLDALKECRRTFNQPPSSQATSAVKLMSIQRQSEVGKPVPIPVSIMEPAKANTPSEPAPPSPASRSIPVVPITKKKFTTKTWLVAAIGLIVVVAGISFWIAGHRNNKSSERDTHLTRSALPTANPNTFVNSPGLENRPPSEALTFLHNLQMPPADVALPASTVRTTFPALANELITLLGAHARDGIAVLEFFDNTTDELGLGGQIGAAGKYFALDTTAYLSKRFAVIDPSTLEGVLRANHFQTHDLGSLSRLEQLHGAMASVDTVVVGAVRRLHGDVFIAMIAIHIPDGKVIGSVSGVLPIDARMLAMFGASYYQPPIPLQEANESKAVALVAKGELNHPLAEASTPYRIEIVQNGIPLPFYKDGNQWYVPATPENTYAIRVTNKSDKLVLVALRIDGLNTIGEVRATSDVGSMWALGADRSMLIDGWQMDQKKRAFVFTDAKESLAHRQNFSDEIGLITAVFYRPRGTRGMGTKEGQETGSEVVKLDIEREDCPAAVIAVHYDRAEVVTKMERVK